MIDSLKKTKQKIFIQRRSLNSTSPPNEFKKNKSGKTLKIDLSFEREDICLKYDFEREEGCVLAFVSDLCGYSLCDMGIV